MSNKKYCILLQASLRLYCWVWYIIYISHKLKCRNYFLNFLVLSPLWLGEQNIQLQVRVGLLRMVIGGKSRRAFAVIWCGCATRSPRVVCISSNSVHPWHVFLCLVFNHPNSKLTLWALRDFTLCLTSSTPNLYSLYLFYQKKYFIWHKRNCTS